MSTLSYQITLARTDGTTVQLSNCCAVTDGAVRVVCEVPEGRLQTVKATMPLRTVGDERIFMNGYQTWTYCPEYTRRDTIRPHAPLPRRAVERFRLDRYGDYHFVEYANKPGVTHGFSYCYFRVGEHFRLIGSLDERPGYTIFRYDARANELCIERDCALVRCGGELHAFDLFFAAGSEDEVFDAWFAAMGVKPRTTEKIAGYSSWYNRYQNIDRQSILRDLRGCASMLRPGDLFQIDDGWEPFVGDWLVPDAKKFPDGMRAVADAIHAEDYRAGLWLAPFVAQEGSAVLREHPDWFLLHEGEKWSCGCNWGGFYALDIDRPEVIGYLEKVFSRVFDEWGFDLVKLDFLYGAAPFGTGEESRAGRMIRAMELLRALCRDKLILGCGVPVMPAFGLVDYCRVSCDVGLDWDDKAYMRLIHRERVSTRQALGNTVFRRQLNGRAYLSDPDVFFLREENVRLTDEQKELLGTVNSLLGGVLMHSDDMAGYGEEAKARYRALRRNAAAVNVRVRTDDDWSLTYELDGREHAVSLNMLKKVRAAKRRARPCGTTIKERKRRRNDEIPH